MKKVLLHVCCGVCSGWAVQKLKDDGFAVVCFFYNPNIQPQEEYAKRLSAARQTAGIHRVEFIEGIYDPQRWFEAVKGLEGEPEAGARCDVCFNFRLRETLRKAEELGIGNFTTTLTISPHKDYQRIKAVGGSLSPEGFLAYNFKKEEGFKKSQGFSRQHGIYRQDYCGCLFGKRDAQKS